MEANFRIFLELRIPGFPDYIVFLFSKNTHPPVEIDDYLKSCTHKIDLLVDR